MLNGTPGEVDILLSSLFEADVEPAGMGSHANPPGGHEVGEKDQEVLFLTQAAKEGKQQAFELLQDKYADAVWKEIRRVESRIMEIPEDLRQDLFNVIWEYTFKKIKDFDPVRSKFLTWLTGISKVIAQRHLPRMLDKERRHGQIQRISPEMEKGQMAKDTTTEFEPEEVELRDELVKYFDAIKSGKEKFPINIRPAAFPGESPEAATDRIKNMYVDIFQCYYGLGAPRACSTDIEKKYTVPDKDGKPKHVDKFLQTSWYIKKFRDVLNQWAQRKGKYEVFANLMNKLNHGKGRKSAPGAQIEEDLLELLAITEGWDDFFAVV